MKIIRRRYKIIKKKGLTQRSNRIFCVSSYSQLPLSSMVAGEPLWSLCQTLLSHSTTKDQGKVQQKKRLWYCFYSPKHSLSEESLPVESWNCTRCKQLHRFASSIPLPVSTNKVHKLEKTKINKERLRKYTYLSRGNDIGMISEVSLIITKILRNTTM